MKDVLELPRMEKRTIVFYEVSDSQGIAGLVGLVPAGYCSMEPPTSDGRHMSWM